MIDISKPKDVYQNQYKIFRIFSINKQMRMFQPQCAILEGIPWSRHKNLTQARRGFTAASYAIHRAYLEKWTSDRDFVPLYSQMMGAIAGNTQTWARAKRLLVGNDVLECDGISKHGRKSLGFALGSKLEGVSWKLGNECFKLPVPPPSGIYEGLTIDYNLAHRILERIAPERGWSRERLNVWHYRITNFSPAYKSCRTGRLFGDFNLIPSEVRDALLLDGKPTEEIDIANSQPALLSSLYPLDSKERATYTALTESGTIYKELGGALGITKEECKKSFLPFLFGSGEEQAFKELFTRKFPELARIVADKMRKNYKGLSWELQRMESEVVLAACERFGGVSIHDGARVPLGKGKEAAQWLENEIFRRFKIRVNVTDGETREQMGRIYGFCEGRVA